MDLVQGIFGGSESHTESQSTSSSQGTSAPVNMTPEQFQALIPQFAAAMGSFAGPAGTGMPSSVGATPGQVAPLGQNEQAVLNMMMNAGWGPRQAELDRTVSGGYLPGSEGANPHLAAAIEAAQRPTMEALQHAVGRQIPGMFARAGHQAGPFAGGASTARDLMQIRATEAGARTAGDIATNMSFGAYESERQRQLAAIGLGQEETRAMLTNLQAQALPRFIEDQGFERGVAAFNTQMDQWLRMMQMAFGQIDPTLGQVTQQTSESQSTSEGNVETSPNIFGSLFPRGIFNPGPR